MNCVRANQLICDSLLGALAPEDRRQLDEHLAGCAACREEATGVEKLWQDLGDLEESQPSVPSDRLTRRFRLALADFEADLAASRGPSLAEWWSGMWSARPAWQAAFAAAMLLVGIFVGAGLTSGRASRGEVEQLRSEINDMSRAVTVSLLRHQSASERLRAVSWSRRAGSDDRVLAALLDSARHDPNVNVRLAAVDALAAYADSVPVRRGLLETLAAEQSPLVQAAVLQAVAGDEGLANGELRRLTESGVVDESLLQHFAAQAESL
jgi:hypothetical protein